MKSWALFFSLVFTAPMVKAQSDTTGSKSSTPLLSRFAISQNLMGPIIPPMMNLEYRALRLRSWSIDTRLGIGGVYHLKPAAIYNDLGLFALYGRGQSKLRLGFGAAFYYWYGREHLDWNEWSEPRFHNQIYQYYFSLGYRFDHKHGFIFGIEALGIGNFEKDESPLTYIGEDWPIHPWGGITFGYRFPSKQLQVQWKQQGQLRKDKVARLKHKLGQDLKVEKLSRIQRRSMNEIDRLERESQRYLTRSSIYVEAGGVGFFWSINYDYSLPVLKNELLYFYTRIGIGGIEARRKTGTQLSSYPLVPVPVLVGFRVMKDFKGGGFGGGIVPYFTDKGIKLTYAFSHDFQLSFGKGFLMGLQFALLLDPENELHRTSVKPWGGVQLGYRFRRTKTNHELLD